MEGIECAVCQSRDFTEHNLGYLICAVCGHQSNSQVVMMEEENIKCTPMKRTTKYIMKKVKKGKMLKATMNQQEYLSTYKRYLDLCVLDMVNKCGIPPLALSLEEQLWAFISMTQPTTTGEIKPKNSDAHIEKRGRPKTIFPTDVEAELAELMGKYRKVKRSDSLPYKKKDLVTECNLRNLDVRTFSTSENMRKIAGILLVSYVRASKRLNKDKLTAEDIGADSLESGLLNDLVLPEMKKMETVPNLPLSQILTVLYVVAYYSSRSKAILASDVLRWVRDVQVRYMTGYQTFGLPNIYVSLFRPTRVPSEEWLRKSVSSFLKKAKPFLGPEFIEPKVGIMMERLGTDLSLHSKIVEIGGKVLERYSPIIDGYVTQRPLELKALAALFIALKLIYGLNGLPYSILTDSLKEKTLQLAKEQGDKVALMYEQIPPLAHLFTVRLIQTWIESLGQHINVPWECGDLGFMSREKIEGYLSMLPTSGMLQNTEFPEIKTLQHDLNFPIKKPKPIRPEPSLVVAEWCSVDQSSINPFLLQELEHIKDPQAEIPLPCMDWQTFAKKASGKTYPGEYVFTIYALCQVGGRQKISELHELVDRLERLVARDEANEH